jgi:hypothetical protein
MCGEDGSRRWIVKFIAPLLSFLKGAASVIDIGGIIHPSLESLPQQSDAESLASDWQAIGSDLYAAIDATCPHCREREVDRDP